MNKDILQQFKDEDYNLIHSERNYASFNKKVDDYQILLEIYKEVDKSYYYNLSYYIPNTKLQVSTLRVLIDRCIIKISIASSEEQLLQCIKFIESGISLQNDKEFLYENVK